MAVSVSYGSSRPGSVTGACFSSRVVGICLAIFVGAVATLPLVMFGDSLASVGTESTPPPPGPSQVQQTNSLEILRAYLQLQEDLHTTQLAIEQNRQEAKAAAAQTAEALAKGLQAIQEALTAQRAQEFQAMQRSNRTVLIVAGTLAGIGFLSLLMVTYFQWRMSQGLAKISAALPTALGLGAGAAVPALGPPESSHLQMHLAMEQSDPALRALNQTTPALKPRTGSSLPAEKPFFPNPAEFFRRRRIRALRTALFVGVVCAATVALVLYLDYLRRTH
jgi:hypothetical protein